MSCQKPKLLFAWKFDDIYYNSEHPLRPPGRSHERCESLAFIIYSAWAPGTLLTPTVSIGKQRIFMERSFPQTLLNATTPTTRQTPPLLPRLTQIRTSSSLRVSAHVFNSLPLTSWWNRFSKNSSFLKACSGLKPPCKPVALALRNQQTNFFPPGWLFFTKCTATPK